MLIRLYARALHPYLLHTSVIYIVANWHVHAYLIRTAVAGLQLDDAIDSNPNSCISVVVGGNDAGQPLILGDPFLRAWFSVFTYSATGSSIQLAQSAILSSSE